LIEKTLWCLVMQVKLQAHNGAARRIIFTVPHAVSDSGVPHQLPVGSKFSTGHLLCCVWSKGGVCLVFVAIRHLGTVSTAKLSGQLSIAQQYCKLSRHFGSIA